MCKPNYLACTLLFLSIHQLKTCIYETSKKTRLKGDRCPSSIKKKTVHDVVAPGNRWTDALRVIRSFHPEATIILPDEKIPVHPGDNVRSLIAPYVAVIRLALDHRVGEWKGHTSECRIKQVRHLLTHYFYFHESCISDKDFDELVEDLLYVHKSKLP